MLPLQSLHKILQTTFESTAFPQYEKEHERYEIVEVDIPEDKLDDYSKLNLFPSTIFHQNKALEAIGSRLNS